MEEKEIIKSKLSSLLHYIDYEDLPMVEKRLADCLLIANPLAKIISSNPLIVKQNCEHKWEWNPDNASQQVCRKCYAIK